MYIRTVSMYVYAYIHTYFLTSTHYRNGLARSEQLIYADPKLSFLESVPKSALFSDPDKMEDRSSGVYRSNLYVAMEMHNHGNLIIPVTMPLFQT